MYLDIVVFLLFLLINILSGVYTVFQKSTLWQYVLGSKVFTTSAIVSSIITISYGGGIFYNSLGLDYLLILTGSAISYFVIGSLLSGRLQLFLNSYSVAEIMGKLYGKHVRNIVAICGILSSSAASAIHLKVLSIAIAWLLDISPLYSLVVATAIVVLMVASGGMQSLTLVSVVRCATFVILLPAIAWVLWKIFLNRYYSYQSDLDLVIKNSWNSLFNVGNNLSYYASCFIVFAIPTLYPAQVQRILIAENAVQIKRSFNYAGLFSLSINLLLIWIVLLLNSIPSNLVISNIPSSIFDDYLGFKGFLVMGIAALAMSTASANLHSATILVVHDLQKILKRCGQANVNPKKYTVIVGFIAMILALYINSPFELLVVANLLFKPIVSVPLLIALMGGSLHRHAVLIGMLVSAVTIMFLQFCSFESSLSSLAPSMVANLATLIIVQVYLKKKPKKSNYNSSLAKLTQEGVPTVRKLCKETMRSILPKIKMFNISDYIERQFPKCTTLYVLFSFYIVITSYCSFYTFSSNSVWGFKLETIILFPSLFVATFFLIYASIVPNKWLRQIAALMWQLSNFYFLVLVGTGMVFLSKFAHLQVITLMLSLSLSILIGSITTLCFRLILTAIVLSIVLPPLGKNVTIVDALLNLNISFLYVMLMVFIFIGGLLYHKENFRKLFLTIQELTVEQKDQNIRQSFRKQQVEVLAYESDYVILQCYNQFRSLPSLDHASFSAAMEKQSEKLRKYFDSLFTYLKYNLYLVTNLTSIEQLLQECFAKIKIKTIYDYPYVVINTDNLYIQCDVERVKKLLMNSLDSCRLFESVNNDQIKDIFIYINDAQLSYRLTLLQGKMQKVDAISLIITTDKQRPAILPVYKVVEMADFKILDKGKSAGRKAFDIENQHIINSHYGYSEIENTDKAITHLYVIPVNVQQVTKAFATFSPVVYTQRVDLDPISIGEEVTFFEKVKERGFDSCVVQDVLKLVKIYYATQRRKTGELFYLHPIAVASILLDITDNSDLIIAGLTHDIVRNTPLTQAGLSTIVGDHITQIVLTAELLEKKLPHQKSEYVSYIQSIIFDKNQNAILLRLADTLHNARTIHGHSSEKQIKKAQLIQWFYLPLAEKMNLTKIANELRLHASNVLA